METDNYKNAMYVKKWFLKLEPEKNTEKSHIQGLKAYCDFTGKTPDQLILEAKADKTIPDIEDRRIGDELLLFRESLVKAGLSPATVRIRMNSVKSFFRHNNIEIPYLGRQKRVNCMPNHKAIPTKDDVRNALLHADKLERAIVLTGLSSGLAEQEISNLRVSDFLKGYDKETEITTLELRRQKTDWDFITFLSPETSKAILDYLAERNRTETSIQEKKIKIQEKQKVYSNDGWLFIRRKVSPKFLEDKDESHRKLSIDAIEKIYQELADRAGIGIHEGGGHFGLLRSHNVRKLFNSLLLNAGCPQWNVEFWMGHKMDGTKAAYFRANPVEMRNTYAKYIPYLTVAKEADVIGTTEYKELMAEKDVWKSTALASQVERYEFEELKNQIKHLDNGDIVQNGKVIFHQDKVEDWF